LRTSPSDKNNIIEKLLNENNNLLDLNNNSNVEKNNECINTK